MTHLLRLQEIAGISEKHLLYTRVQDDGCHWALVAGVCPAPTAMRICEIDLYAMDSFSFVLLLGLKNQLLQDGIVPCNDTGEIEEEKRK